MIEEIKTNKEHQPNEDQETVHKQRENKVIQSITQHLIRASMPKFAMYSRVEKDLLQCLLVRATEFSDQDVDGLRIRFFSNSPAHDPKENSEANIEK